MGVASYAALAERKLDRSRKTSLTVAVVVGVTCVLLLLRWHFAPSVFAASELGILYPSLYYPMIGFCVLMAVLLEKARWRVLPLVFTVVVMAFAAVLTWIDTHFGVDFLVFTISIFAVGVIYSTGPLGYGLLLGGSFLGLVALIGLTVPHRLAEVDFLVEGILLGLAYAGCLMLENQRRESDEMAVKLEDVNEQLRETAFRDSLTGLYNRRFLVEFLERKRALSVRMSIPLSAVLIDLDHFKKINDTLGHAVGDAVLQEIGHALLEGIRESDLAARYGGEEFMLILPQADESAAALVTQRILEKVRVTNFLGVPWPVTFSAGVSQFRGGESIEALLERADKRLYEAKAERNRIVGAPVRNFTEST